MNDKERLEKIQQNDLIQAISDGFLFGKDGLKTENIFRDVEWIIQQAERVQELEQQNKCYREALNNIIALWIASTDATDDTWLAHEMSETARQALEGEK